MASSVYSDQTAPKEQSDLSLHYLLSLIRLIIHFPPLLWKNMFEVYNNYHTSCSSLQHIMVVCLQELVLAFWISFLHHILTILFTYSRISNNQQYWVLIDQKTVYKLINKPSIELILAF